MTCGNLFIPPALRCWQFRSRPPVNCAAAPVSRCNSRPLRLAIKRARIDYSFELLNGIFLSQKFITATFSRTW